MEDVMTTIESVYKRLQEAQEENAKLRKLVADYKELYEDMKAHSDESYTLAHTAINDLKTMRKRIAAVLDGGEA